MLFFNLDTSKIYFPEIREYFEEVLGSYTSGHYRSAIVLLYSVAVCDIMKKLNELKDFYNDKKAKTILDNIEKNKSSKNNLPTQWENELIEQLDNNNLFTQQELLNLKHLKENRNLAAHPTLNLDFNLVQPTPEKTIAFIKDMYEIFIKPPFFIDNVVDRMSDELSQKKDLYMYDFDKLKIFVNNAYIARMTDTMLEKVFKAYWKFVFLLAETKPCKDDLELNRKVLGILYEQNPFLLEQSMQKDLKFFNKITNSDAVISCLVFFLSRHPEIYKIIDISNRDMIDNYINKEMNFSYKFISWFKEDDRDKYLKELKIPSSNNNIVIYDNFIKYAQKQKKSFYNSDTLKEFFIRYYSESSHFEESRVRYSTVIKPFLHIFNEQDFIKIISSIDENNQHYDNWNQERRNIDIAFYLRKINAEFDFSKYKRFKYNIDLLQEMESEIPF